MNIIFLEDSSKAGFGGGQKITIDVISSVLNLYQIYLFDTVTSSHFTKELNNFKIVPNKLKYSSNNSNSILSRLISFIFNPFYFLFNLNKLKNFIIDNSIKKNCLIYAASKYGLLLAFVLNKYFNIDFIYHAHMIENIQIKKLLCYLTKNAFRVICVSELVAEQFQNQNVIVISNSIDLIEVDSKYINLKNRFIVAIFSTLNNIKGIDDFIESHQHLKNKNIIYHIYGDGPLKPKILSKVNNNIIYLGHAKNVKDILINNVDLLVVPTIISESFCMIMIEAFSCGVPAIGTNLGMQKYHLINSKAGDLFQIKNPKDLASKIDNIFKDHLNYNMYSVNAINYSKKFNKLTFNKHINDVFKNYNLYNQYQEK